MSNERMAAPSLQALGCRKRRQRFADAMTAKGLDAAVLTTPAHLAYFFGVSGWRSEFAASVVRADGSSVLSLGASANGAHFADQVVRFEDTRGGTPSDDREGLAVRALGLGFADGRPIGSDGALSALGTATSVTSMIADLRRRKDPDEVELVTAAIRATEAGYRAIVPLVRPGVSAMEVYAVFYGAAAIAAGTSLPELGNDFRGGAPGGRPRSTLLQAGDLLPVDAGVRLAQYNADLCRTYAVSGVRNSDQQEAFKRVEDALFQAESLIGLGVRCRDVYTAVAELLNVRSSWRFNHHLGHGMGIHPVEAPRISPHWDDVFQEGDVFTLEPGLYGESLRAGVRLEQNYVIEDGRLRVLSVLPLDL